ncbi:MAG: type II toxin-antitoxin system RelB/DinJ family antitoxin [Oscillospiraceae bacterium]|nr:type II toxin-antitoxin system RelB/DinJ family antitoxin [Oscillospiraceae bacterium]
MSTVNVTLRMDKELKAQAEALFEDMGLSLSAACRIFLTQAVKEQRIPFEITRRVPDRATRKAIEETENEGAVLSSVEALMEELDG